MDEIASHEIATIFPLIEGTELEGLAADIKEQGLLEPVVLYEGKILDGRNRYRACQMAGVKPRYEEFRGTPEEAISRVWSLNFERRHLTSSQRAACDAVRNKLMNSYAAVREAAKLRQMKTHLAGKDKAGKPVVVKSINTNGTSVTQLIAEPKGQPTETREVRAKAVGTNREYIDLADKLLEQEPEVFRQVQSGAKALTQVRREKARVAKPREPKTANRVPIRFVRLHLEYIDTCLKEPQPVSLARIAAITGLKAMNILKNSILQYWQLVPWVEIAPVTPANARRHKSPQSVLYTFKQNRYLRAVCEGRGPRASVELKTIITALGDLRREIDHDRNEAKINRNRNWNPVVVQKAELVALLDHIETALDKLVNLG